ncbi:unnamed protein product [Thelazia callipaeda]|uniref:FYVE-type domain-containing protein n=1 Tax=Thelazia callipaeda TaxID=103827 RepID=A0A0N5CRK5_THECL|nr:unnamed protein product [Thelazia callipaeda]
MAFKNKPEYKIVVDTHNLMKLAGFDFPRVTEADAMFIAESAPEWADGEECFRCRTAFGIITRKHHCRACGQIFCDKCSSKQSFLPQYGIEKQVRVCDGCYDKVTRKVDVVGSSSSVLSSFRNNKSFAVDAQKIAEQQARELKQTEEEQMNLAIALSQSEAEAQERDRQRRLYDLYNGADILKCIKTDGPFNEEPSKSACKGGDPSLSMSSVDPELARYLNRDYWQNRKNEQHTASSVIVDHQKMPTPTAPPPSESSRCALYQDRDGASSIISPSFTTTAKHPDCDATPASQFITAEEEETAETMEFCRQLAEQVTVMDNRIRSNLARNRSVVNDTAIQSLFIRLTEMHAQVMTRINKLEDQRNHFESLQDNLAHIQEARQAMDSLREDHERRRQAKIMEEQRLKQIQMQQKVDLMRQKKHEMILHQREMALLRFQQQEHELQLKRMQSMRQNSQINLPVQPSNVSYNQIEAEPGQHYVIDMFFSIELKFHGFIVEKRNQTVMKSYPSNVYVDQGHAAFSIPVSTVTQDYTNETQTLREAMVVKDDLNMTSYAHMSSYGDQVVLNSNLHQQEFLKQDALPTNYQLSVSQSSLQPPGTHNVSPIQSTVPLAYSVHLSPVNHHSFNHSVGQQQVPFTSNVDLPKVPDQHVSTFIQTNVPPVLPLPTAQHITQLMPAYPSYLSSNLTYSFKL